MLVATKFLLYTPQNRKRLRRQEEAHSFKKNLKIKVVAYHHGNTSVGSSPFKYDCTSLEKIETPEMNFEGLCQAGRVVGAAHVAGAVRGAAAGARPWPRSWQVHPESCGCRPREWIGHHSD